MPIAPDTRRELLILVRLARPLVAGQVLLFGSNVVDAMLAGHLSAEVLGAVAVGSSVYTIPLMLLQGLMFTVPAKVSQLVGAGRRREVGLVFRQALYLAALTGLLSGLALWGLAHPLATLLQLEPALRDGVVAFLRGLAPGLPALGVFMACRGFSDGLSLTRPAMWFGLLSIILLLPLGYVLMYGAFGLPGRGAGGSGIATACALWIETIVFVAYISRAAAYRDIGWERGRMAPDPSEIASLLRLGIPMATSVVLETSLFSAASFAIARFGSVAVSAHQIALNVAALAFMVPLGMAGAITVRVGDAAGAGDIRRARLAGFLGVKLVMATQSVSCLVMLVLPVTIASLYSADLDVQAGTVSLLVFAAMFQLSDGIQVAANGALRGMHDTRLPALITLIAYWGIGAPVGLLLAFEAGMAGPGMWLGLVAGLSVAAGLLTWRFARRTLVAVQHADTLIP
jgi:MATE family multidrug resistance protein